MPARSRSGASRFVPTEWSVAVNAARASFFCCSEEKAVWVGSVAWELGPGCGGCGWDGLVGSVMLGAAGLGFFWGWFIGLCGVW